MNEPTPTKRKRRYPLAVLVCEIRPGGLYWPLMKVHQEKKGCVIESGERMAGRCLQVLPEALDLVAAKLAEHNAELELLTRIFREEWAAAEAGISTQDGTDTAQ